MDKSLGRKLITEREADSFLGIHIGRGVKSINNAEFHDDIMLLGGASVNNAFIYKHALNQL